MRIAFSMCIALMCNLAVSADLSRHADDYGGDQRLKELSESLSQGSYNFMDDIEGSISPVNGYSGWSINCRKDRFNGIKQCFLINSDLKVVIRNGEKSVFIGKDHFPRSESAIKVDNNSTIYGYEGLSKSPLKAIEQMKNGKVLYTRYVEWPYEFNRDNEIDLTGFKENYAEIIKQYSQL